MLFIVLYAICFRMGALLRILGQSQQVATVTQDYLVFFSPSVYIYYLADLQRKFLNSFGKNFLPMIAYIITAVCYPFVAYFLAIHLDMKLKGLGICYIVMNTSSLSIMLLLTWWDKETRQTMFWPDRSSYNNFNSYFNVGGPNIIQ